MPGGLTRSVTASTCPTYAPSEFQTGSKNESLPYRGTQGHRLYLHTGGRNVALPKIDAALLTEDDVECVSVTKKCYLLRIIEGVNIRTPEAGDAIIARARNCWPKASNPYKSVAPLPPSSNPRRRPILGVPSDHF